MIFHDLRCLTCEREERDVAVRAGVFPPCACGGARTWIPRQLNTDMGSGFFCEATWQTHSRHKDAELAMAKQARAFTEKTGIRWEPQAAGDKVGGARLESRKVNAAFGYAGQGSRRSRGEQSVAGSHAPTTERSAPFPERGGPRRITREQAQEIRRSPVYKG